MCWCWASPWRHTSRRFAHDSRFAFGTWKIEVLSGYTSAIFLIAIAGLILYQSVECLISPTPISYDQAIAIIGLLVDLACAWLLKGGHNHHGHEHHGNIHDHHHDLNLSTAYLHVLADAATFILAISALIGGKFWGASWLDPVMGIIGAVLVTIWAYGLLRDSGRVLLDAEMSAPAVTEIRDVIDSWPINAHISDLYVWRVGKGKYACILSLVIKDDAQASAEYFKQELSIHEELVHITVELRNHRTSDKLQSEYATA